MSEPIIRQRDPRLDPLFDDDSHTVMEACLDLVKVVFDDPELEQELIELLETTLDEGEGYSSGVICSVLLLGEVRSTVATPVILRCLQQDDEVLQRASIRTMRRIGSPAFDAVIELLDDIELDGELAALAIECLEGVSLHDLPQSREAIEECLRADLMRPQMPVQRTEATALALAHLGVVEAIEIIERVLDRDFPDGNAFITDALDLLRDHPQGLSGFAEDPIENVLRWLSAEILPGAELEQAILLDPEEDSTTAMLLYFLEEPRLECLQSIFVSIWIQ